MSAQMSTLFLSYDLHISYYSAENNTTPVSCKVSRLRKLWNVGKAVKYTCLSERNMLHGPELPLC